VERGTGYPQERAEVMAKNRGILKELKAVSCRSMIEVLQDVDSDLLRATVAGKHFEEYFFANAKDTEIRDYIRGVIDN